jgi:polysaccharide chain length determinant protein (PEP-CTERM system associated)
MMEEQSFHPLDYLAMVNRRKWWFIGPLAFCLLAGAAAVLVWPKQYLSQAAIAVASPSLSPTLLRGVSSLDPAERQRAISQQLLSPEVLERVVREERINPKKPVVDAAASLRENVASNVEVPNPIGLAANARPDPSHGIDMFYLGYTDSDPQRAQRIANRLANVFVEVNSRQQTMRAENTSDVLAHQVAEAQDHLRQIEERLTAKKQTYMGRLPDQIPANVQMVNGARNQLESVSTQLHGEQERLNMIESQLDQMRAGVGGEAMTSTGAAAVQTAQKHIDDLQGELAQDRAIGYTDKHPEIIRLQEEIKQAKADLVAARKQTPEDRDQLLRADPLYRQKLQERDASRLHVRELQASAAQLSRQIGTYQARVDSAPMVEQELASVQRDYDLAKKHYEDLNSQYLQAQQTEELARKQAGERFSVLYPATLPDDPIEPQPMKILAIAIVAGFVLGAGGALGREFLDRSVYDVKALQNEFDVPVLGEIPRIAT